MSLSKEICKRCVRRRKRVADVEPGWTIGWDADDERIFAEHREVVCSAGHVALVDEPPPWWCLYAPEQLVSNESEEGSL